MKVAERTGGFVFYCPITGAGGWSRGVTVMLGLLRGFPARSRRLTNTGSCCFGGFAVGPSFSRYRRFPVAHAGARSIFGQLSGSSWLSLPVVHWPAKL